MSYLVKRVWHSFTLKNGIQCALGALHIFIVLSPISMMHLITIVGDQAEHLYLKSDCISDFKAVIRTVTAGRVLIVSTKFRSDLFYAAKEEQTEAILKMWALYANGDTHDIDLQNVKTIIGEKACLSSYFESLNILANHWYHYDVYKKTFGQIFEDDQDNPLATVVAQCDHFLATHSGIKRTPLICSYKKPKLEISKDTFSIAMKLMNKEGRLN